MATKSSDPVASAARPSLSVRPANIRTGSVALVEGRGWPLDAIDLTIDRARYAVRKILRGTRWHGRLVPDADGTFLIAITTRALKTGRHVLHAESAAGRASANVPFQIDRRVAPGPRVPRARIDKPYLRGAAFMRQRVSARGDWPAGALEAFRHDWLRKYGRRGGAKPGGAVFFSAPVPGGCNWVPLGPAPFTTSGSLFGDNTGRTRSFAIDPTTPSRLYAGTASGGVWKSTNTGATWVPTSDGQFSLAIGALAIDPNSTNIIYAGTGEMVPGDDYGSYYGRGLLRSSTFGDAWSEIGTSEFSLAEIARIVINPLDSSNLFVAASNGLWESATSGSSWTCLAADPCTDVVLVQDPAEPGVRRLIAGFSLIGVRQSADSGTGWSSFSDVAVPGMPIGPKRTVFGVCRTHPNTIYAAFSTPDGGMLGHVARSDTWGASWIARTIPLTGRLWQASYNLVIQPHPVTPDTVLLGVVDVFKSGDGGGSWTVASSGMGAYVHADVHSISWHPSDANAVYVTGDGGIIYTPDLCASWEPHNLNVACLQFYDLGQHPDYETIMVAGSQDNGGFHYTGAPIWKTKWVGPNVTHNEMDGDVVVAQIDPFDPYFHYYGTGPEASMWRSTDAGRFYTDPWSSFPGTQWWIPFSADPRTAGVLLTGGTRVMRSVDRGLHWDEISSPLATPLRAIGFHPTDPLVLYAGTVGGQVYRLNGPAMGPWTTATVTTTDVTFTGVPAGVGISSLAVDPSGTVWATISNLLETEGTGEFSNDHVLRLDAGATAWVSKSSGLVQANPINTIVIDPADASRVFCGGDRGVFAWNASAETWAPMDEGLPNAPVMKLLIHQPSRKLRAATYGRSVWERPLDPGFCSDQFVYFRDNLVDSGRTPSPDGVPHPYLAGEQCWHWQSEDIIVDAYNQTPALATSPMEVYDRVEDRGAKRGANRVYVTVHNKGAFAATAVRVRAFFAPASAGLPPFPPGLVADPFLFSPGATSAWSAVGPVFTIPRLEPGTTGLAAWNLTIPASAPAHSCLLAFVTSNEDPFLSAGVTNPDQLVVENRKVTLKNLNLDAMPGSPGGGGGSNGGGGYPAGSTAPHVIQLHARESQAASRIVIHAGHVPDDAVVVVALDRDTRRRLRAGDAKASKKAHGIRNRFARIRKPARELAGLDLRRVLAHDLHARQALHLGDAVLTHGQPSALAVWLHSRRWKLNETYTIDVVQMTGDRITGGYTIRFTNLQRRVVGR